MCLSRIPRYSLPEASIAVSSIPAAYLERDNADFVLSSKTVNGIDDREQLWYLFSPETSGGLLIMANPKERSALTECGCLEIGVVTAQPEIIITP